MKKAGEVDAHSLRLWTIPELSRASELSIPTLKAMVREGTLQVVYVGKQTDKKKSIRIPNHAALALLGMPGKSKAA